MRTASLVLLCVGLVAAGYRSKLTKSLRIRQVLSPACSVDEFECANGRCIQEEWTCDGDNDCTDNSDETVAGCSAQCSGDHKFLCKNNNSCQPIEYRCDGENDCSDGSDEADCMGYTCTSNEAHCNNGLCIEKEYLCDGDDDCGNGWDENPANCAK